MQETREEDNSPRPGNDRQNRRPLFKERNHEERDKAAQPAYLIVFRDDTTCDLPAPYSVIGAHAYLIRGSRTPYSMSATKLARIVVIDRIMNAACETG